MKRIAILSLLLAACTDESGSRETLRKSGYTDITLTGWSPLTCGKDDTFSTGFRARNSNGSMVDGVVCCGLLFKSCTVRF
jgi:hypothetical protein